MTHIEFFPYHNYHIIFKLKDGREMSGILVDTIRFTDPSLSDTVYKYIPTLNMIEWKQAEQKGDKKKMEDLEGKIDITDIVWAERMKY